MWFTKHNVQICLKSFQNSLDLYKTKANNRKQARYCFLLLLLCSQLYLWGSSFWLRILPMWPVFNQTTEVVTFCLPGQHILGVFLLPPFTHLGDTNVRVFESMQWSACVHRLDLGKGLSWDKRLWLNPSIMPNRRQLSRLTIVLFLFLCQGCLPCCSCRPSNSAHTRRCFSSQFYWKTQNWAFHVGTLWLTHK